ncbi:response regulator transcription factor [Geodermatophilus sp. SYSU D00708]
MTTRLIRPAAPVGDPPRTPVTTVLVADAHPVLRRVLTDCLDDTDDITVVAEAETGDELLESGLRTRPRIVLVDPELPGTDPLQAARELLDVAPGTRVVVLARCFSLVNFHRARRLGAVGYLLKGADLVDLPRRIRELAEGGTAWTPRAISEVDPGER